MEEVIRASPEYMAWADIFFRIAVGVITLFLGLIAFFLGQFYKEVKDVKALVQTIQIREAAHLADNIAFVKKLDEFCARMDKSIESHQIKLDSHHVRIAILEHGSHV